MATFVRYKKEKSFVTKKEKIFLKKYLIFFLIILILLFGIFLLLKRTVWADSRYVSSIIYDENSRAYVSDQQLYDTLTSLFYGKNIYAVRYVSYNDILMDIQQEYPFVRELIIQDFVAGQLTVGLSFFEPQLRLSTTRYTWGIYDDYAHFIQSGDTIGTGTDILFFPDYLSGTRDLSGVSFLTDFPSLIYFHDRVTSSMQYIDQLYYIPGGEKLVVRQGTKQIYFNMLANVDRQLEKLFTLQANYTGYNQLTSIDLGSVSEVIIQ